MIPHFNPHTFEDILSCKTISPERVKKDYKNLRDFDALHNPRKFCGNRIIYHYQFKNLINCRRGTSNYKTIQEYYEDPILKEELWKEAIHRNRVDKNPFPSPTDVYECHRLNKGAIVTFKASTAKYIYKKFGATSVLDPTAGWGGRLLAAASLGIKYTGYDTNTNMKTGYDEMIKDLDIKNCEMRWRTCESDDFSDIEYDLILTSPPYFNMELYEHMTPFDNEYDFYNNWLVPLMSNAYEGLSVGGKMCINISPKMYKKLLTIGGFSPCNSTVDLRQQMGRQFKKKSQDYIYIWNKD